MRMEAVLSSETSVSTYESTRRNNPGEQHHNFRFRVRELWPVYCSSPNVTSPVPSSSPFTSVYSCLYLIHQMAPRRCHFSPMHPFRLRSSCTFPSFCIISKLIKRSVFKFVAANEHNLFNYIHTLISGNIRTVFRQYWFGGYEQRLRLFLPAFSFNRGQ
jgi:hypothetical protein